MSKDINELPKVKYDPSYKFHTARLYKHKSCLTCPFPRLPKKRFHLEYFALTSVPVKVNTLKSLPHFIFRYTVW